VGRAIAHHKIDFESELVDMVCQNLLLVDGMPTANTGDSRQKILHNHHVHQTVAAVQTVTAVRTVGCLHSLLMLPHVMNLGAMKPSAVDLDDLSSEMNLDGVVGLGEVG